MPNDYVICVRNVDRTGQFGTEPGKTRFLSVPPGQLPNKSQEINQRNWVAAVLAEAEDGKDARTGLPTGDVLVFIHGFNNGQQTVMGRHRLLKSSLEAAGYEGAVVSFDWPSAECALAYLEDRSDAKATARRLVDDCITLLAARQANQCRINVHLLGHSTGAYVIREAFDDADDCNTIENGAWTVSQIALIAGDVSSGSMSEEDSSSKSLYRHCIRLTNYSNGLDSVLALSNAKRLGFAPRVGRVGLPDDAPTKAVEVDCTGYFKTLTEPPGFDGVFNHSWHIGDPVFTQDLLYTLWGEMDRARIPTRQPGPGGKLVLGPES